MSHSYIPGTEIRIRLLNDDPETGRLSKARFDDTPVSLPDREGLWHVTNMRMEAGPDSRQATVFTLARVKQS